MQFEYSAINNENKKLNGFINASDENNARLQLNNLGLAILAIKIADKQNESKKEKLKFEALDKNGKRIIGTIPEINIKKAYKRLIEEYNFQVVSLYSLDANNNEIEASKIIVKKLKNEYEEELANQSVDDILSPKEKQIRIELLKEVEIILQKVNGILVEFDGQIKPEEIRHIKEIEDRLLRLRNSNNLNYIKQTSKSLLKLLQDEEIYINKNKFVNRKDKLKLKTQKLLLDMNKINTKPNIDIIDNNSKIFKLKNILFKEKEVENTKINQLKKEIRKISSEIFDYRKIWFRTSKQLKPEVNLKIKDLSENKKQLVAQLKSLKKTEKLQKTTNKKEINKDLISITGWLLTFYIIYYFINYYLTFKRTIFSNTFALQNNIFNTPIFTYLILGIFFTHIALQINQLILNNNRTFTYTIYPLIFIIIILININF